MFWRWALVISLLISVAAAAIAARNRTPWSDEGWFSSAAYNLAHHGFMGTTVLESAGTGFTRIAQRTYWVMPLYLLGEALWYKLAPADIFSTRWFTILWIPAALLAFYVFLRRLLPDSPAPALAVCLLAMSFIFIDNAGFARPDLMCCALGLGGLAAYLALRERRLARALFVANALVAASGLTHPNGIFHLAALAVLVLWFDRRRLSLRLIATAVLPYLIMAAAWSLYILRDARAFADQLAANGTNGRWTATLNPIAILWTEIRERYLVAFGLITRGVALFKLFALLAYLGGVAGCLASRRLRQQESTRVLLTLLAVYFAAMCLFNQKLHYYLIHILPIYIALLAVWIVHLWTVQPRLRPVLGLAVIVLVSLETGGILLKARQRSYVAVQRPAVEFVLAHTPPDGRIVGTAALLYELRFDPRLRDDPYLGLHSGRTPDVIVVEPLYRMLYDSWQTQRPADMRQIDSRLSSYALAYRRGGYEVYLPPATGVFAQSLRGGTKKMATAHREAAISTTKVRASEEMRFSGQLAGIQASTAASR